MSIYGEAVFETEDFGGYSVAIVNRVDSLSLIVRTPHEGDEVILQPEDVAVLEAALYKWRMQHEFENRPYSGMP